MFKHIPGQTQTKSASDKADSSEGKSAVIKVARVHRGPSTTLMIECPALAISPFSLDIVNSLHHRHARLWTNSKTRDKRW